MRVAIAALAALAFAGPALAGTGMAGMKLDVNYDGASGAPWCMDETASGKDLTPTATKADRFVAPFYSIVNHTPVAVQLLLHGRWSSNFDGNLSLASAFANFQLIELEPGEDFPHDGGRSIELHAVTLLTTIPSGYVLVIGWD